MTLNVNSLAALSARLRAQEAEARALADLADELAAEFGQAMSHLRLLSELAGGTDPEEPAGNGKGKRRGRPPKAAQATSPPEPAAEVLNEEVIKPAEMPQER
jgi:hypothetical protein